MIVTQKPPLCYLPSAIDSVVLSDSSFTAASKLGPPEERRVEPCGKQQNVCYRGDIPYLSIIQYIVQ